MLGFALPKGVLSYAFMPQVMPRLRSLITGGLGHIPYFLALIYQMVGLLPQSHPYVMGYNVGRFGVRHVIAEAANNLEFNFKNLDQIILFAVILVGLVIFVIQFFAMAAILFMQPAMALPNSWADLFTIPVAFRNHDIASMMLDMVFGVPYPSGTGPSGSTGFFESCIAAATLCEDNFGLPVLGINLATTSVPAIIGAQFSPLSPGAHLFFPFPYHDAMHTLFSVYSTGLLIIAVVITSYFVATVVAETAQSGIPFGRRFNKTWAPIRIVVAFGLLVPLAVGLNSSQYIVLYAAKYGSAFATNGWRYFNNTLTDRYLGYDAQRLISTPNIPDMKTLPHFMYVAQTCKYVYEFLDLQRRQQQAEAAGDPPVTALTTDQEVHAYAITRHSAGTSGFSSVRIGNFTLYQQIVNGGLFLPRGASYYTVRFGIRDEVRFPRESAFVSPICGEVQMVVHDGRPLLPITLGPPASFLFSEPGPGQMQEAYFNIIRDMWHPGITWTGGFWTGLGTVPHLPFAAHRFRESANRVVQGLPLSGAAVEAAHSIPVDPIFVQQAIDTLNTRMRNELLDAVTDQLASPRWGGTPLCGASPAALCEKGWAAAGIWYNRLAEMNGAVTAATYSSPIITRFPAQMEKIADIKKIYDQNISVLNRFKPEVAGVDDITSLLGEGFDSDLAKALYVSYSEWDTSAGDPRSTEPTGNPFLSAVSSIFGLNGLFSIRDNTDTHPLAMLSGIGRSLVEGAIKSLGMTALMVTTGLVFDGLPGDVAGVAARFFVMVAMIGLTVGFVLFYVVPFLPFLYFFFAVGGWIKGIFEAMVGAPLWALAHIRIDGNGLPGNAALNGYFLIFEVFLRPILIVFGLLASISTYSALVNVLNNVFDLVVQNASGYDIESELIAPQNTISYMRSLIDEFFFTVIYAIVVYMLGMSSFKLIDTIPNNILRWMGQSVATFNDQREDVAQALVSKASIGSQQVISRIGGGLSQAVGAATK